VITLTVVYQPDRRLPDFVTDLRAATSPEAHFVIVDDGSDAAHRTVVDHARLLGATVLRHDVNRGKGAALKTGLRYIRDTHPGEDVVCADPDGQHRIDDVVRVAGRVHDAGRMVLGVRGFDGDVPLRSRLGNALTRRLFRAATGHRIRDTQTGLRGYPGGFLDWLVTVPGERFEYEMNVLIHAVHAGYRFEQVTIATSYVDENESSHFGSISDSIRVYLPLLRLALSSSRR
jgi:glycosyltransferase involved in cell wall biosynthesis